MTPAQPHERAPIDIRRLHLWQIQAVRDAMFIAAIVGLVWLGYAMRSVTVPLLVALLLAYLFEPLIVWACRRYNARRPVMAATLVCSIAVVFVLCLAIAVPVVVSQTMQMVRDLRYGGRLERTFIALREYVPNSMVDTYDDTISGVTQFLGTRYRPPKPRTLPAGASTQPAGSMPAAAPGDAATQPDTMPATTEPATDEFADDHILPPLTESEIREIVKQEVADQIAVHEEAAARLQSVAPIDGSSDNRRQAMTSIWNISRSTVGAILGFLGQVLKVGFLFFLIPFYLFFFSMWYPQIAEFGRGLIPRAREKETLELLRKMDNVIAGFVRGRIVISMIIGVICAIGWSLCGVPYAIVLGLITGIFSAVPYLGGVGLPVAILLLWVDQLGIPVSQRMSVLGIIGWPTLVFVIMQLLETYIITPTIAGKATNLDPVTILVAVIAGGSVGGVYGMLLAIPTAACLKILLTDVFMPRVRLWVKGRAEDPLPL